MVGLLWSRCAVGLEEQEVSTNPISLFRVVSVFKVPTLGCSNTSHKCNVALIPALPRFFFCPQLRAALGAVPMAGCAVLHPAASSGHGSVLQ